MATCDRCSGGAGEPLFEVVSEGDDVREQYCLSCLQDTTWEERPDMEQARLVGGFEWMHAATGLALDSDPIDLTQERKARAFDEVVAWLASVNYGFDFCTANTPDVLLYALARVYFGRDGEPYETVEDYYHTLKAEVAQAEAMLNDE